MIKKLHFKTLLLIAALVMGVGNVWGEEENFYTLTPASGSNNAYAGNCDITISDKTWNLTGNSQTNPWRIGGKSITNTDRALYSKTAIAEDVTKIEVTHGAASNITVNSWTVIVAKDDDFTDVVSTLTPSFAANSTTTINRPDGKDWSNCYYKFIYNVTVSGSSNKYLEFTNAKFYKEVSNSEPSIEVASTSVNATSAETEGTINVTYNNITDVVANVNFYEADGTTPATYDWIIAEINATTNNLDYAIDANTGAERTAYMKVLALDDESNEVYSDLITITQAAYVAPAKAFKYSLFSGDLEEGDYIIYYDGKAMNTTVSDRLQYEEVTPEGDIITTNNSAIVWHIAPNGDYWTIYNAEEDAYAASTGAKNKAQMLEDGTDDKALWTVSGTSTYEFVNKQNAANAVNANLRNNGTYGFACYSDATGGALSLYKKMTVPLTITDAGFATFCSAYALDFSGVAGLTAYKAVMNGTTVEFTEVSDVPAETGVLVKGAADTYNIPVVASSTTDVSGNKLVGVTAATVIDGTSGNFFVLKKVGENVGFYKVNNAAYTVRANTAYLNAEGAGAKDFIGFDDGETTSIESIHNSWLSQAAKPSAQFTIHTDAPMFNLSGQRVSESYKGIVIVNGKKVIRK